MAQPYVGEIRMFAGNFPPNGWLFCEGQTLPISENDVLFQLIGTTYGGDGQETFNLPNLASRVPIHFGTGPDGTTYQIGEMAGTESVTLTTQQIPQHTHAVLATNASSSQFPGGALMGPATSAQTGVKMYGVDTPLVSLSSQSVTTVGGNQPHENCQPFLCINFIISLFGVFPSPT
ncbi:MAG: phage tail protein [Caulobacteraceae bacterium]|nr:MAG: phage tail protein [Caulobacteraceae bacterium]